MKIVVDADACPVKEEIVQVAARFETPVIMVASYAHVLPGAARSHCRPGRPFSPSSGSVYFQPVVPLKMCSSRMITDWRRSDLPARQPSSPSVVTFFRAIESDSCWNVGMRCPGPGVEVCVSKVPVLSIIKTALDFTYFDKRFARYAGNMSICSEVIIYPFLSRNSEHPITTSRG